MSDFKIPTTQESVDNATKHLTTALNTDAPENDKAFLKVLAVLLGMNQTSQYRHAIERSKQNLALTATGEDLEEIGAENDIFKKPAEQFQFLGDWNGDAGTEITIGTECLNEGNGKKYFPTQNVTIGPSGSASVPLTAEEYGADSNLGDAGLDTVTIVPDIEGANQIITLNVTTQLGVDAEEEEDFRIRVLDEERSIGGGSNLADYRKWGQETSGVRRIYPYTGISPDFSQSIPGYRTVFVEAQTAIDPDGIAPQPLLDAVRLNLNIDPDTGLSRPCLGSVDSQLEVKSIYRTGFYFTVRGLIVDPSNEVAAKADISEALDKYARSRVPFVWGLDSDIDQNNFLTSAGAGTAAENAIIKYGAQVGSVAVGKVPGQALPPYPLMPGERGYREDVAYES